jgi:HAD superfamily hydrolase (TIGR01549 family)
MVRAVLFDLFETLITESRTRPPGVSSLAPALGCDRDAFRSQWHALRPAVMIGRLSFRQALSDIATSLGGAPDDLVLQQLCDQRVRTKAEPFEEIEQDVLGMIDDLRSRGIRLGVVSNGFTEDVAAWPRASLAPRFDCAVFSCEVGLAKPDPAIYREATRRLQADVSHTWFIGDGGHDELSGAEQAGLRPFKATWFLRRWPHFRPDPGPFANVASVEEIASLVERERDGLNRP